MVVVGMKYIASVSFGKDSLAMLLRIMEEKKPLDAVVFYDTGMEFDAIYRIRDRMKPILSQVGINFIELHPSEPFLYSMLERPVKSRQDGSCHQGYAWCGGRCRWGTTAKTAAIRKFKKSISDEVTDYVGIATDEPDRFEKEKSAGKVLPLVEWDMTEADCLSYCRHRGWNWSEKSPVTVSGMIDLYDILDRVSCWCCANKNLRELQNIYWYLPQYWSRLEDLQRQISRPFKGFYKNEPQGIFELKRRFDNDTQMRRKEICYERGKYQ